MQAGRACEGYQPCLHHGGRLFGRWQLRQGQNHRERRGERDRAPPHLVQHLLRPAPTTSTATTAGTGTTPHSCARPSPRPSLGQTLPAPVPRTSRLTHTSPSWTRRSRSTPRHSLPHTSILPPMRLPHPRTRPIAPSSAHTRRTCSTRRTRCPTRTAGTTRLTVNSSSGAWRTPGRGRHSHSGRVRHSGGKVRRRWGEAPGAERARARAAVRLLPCAQQQQERQKLMSLASQSAAHFELGRPAPYALVLLRAVPLANSLRQHRLGLA